ncbi:MAG TPA: NAD(P)-dependent oxidoreductase [Nitrospiraceae bacterium]|nr:NAD(P)-dependent oxidoreductase [Nitrospiraceae bacterium]
MRITILGTGILGRAIADRLHRADQRVTVYNRTRSKAEPLEKLGITVADSCEDAVSRADVIILLLADAPAIRSMLFENLGPNLAGRTVIQMGTIGPDESRSFQKEAVAAGGDYCEAPVLGSVSEARNGTLLVLFAGIKSQLDRLAEVFRPLTPCPVFVGPVGKAAALKLALNQLIAAETAAFSLSLGIVQREAIDVEVFMDVLRNSALFAPTYEKKLPRFLDRDYRNPNFSTRHLLKDVRLVLNEAKMCGLSTGALEGILPLLSNTITGGLGDMDYSAIYEAINPRPRLS